MDIDRELQARVHAVEDWLQTHVPHLWGFEQRLGSVQRNVWQDGQRQAQTLCCWADGQAPRLDFRRAAEDPEWPLLQATMAAFQAQFGDDAAVLSDFLFHPALQRLPEPQTAPDPDPQSFQQQAAILVGRRCLMAAARERRDPALLRGALERARFLLRDGPSHPERDPRWHGSPMLSPQLRELRPWLNADFPCAEHEPELAALLAGEWNATIPRDAEPGSSYAEELYALREWVMAAMDHCRARGQFDYAAFSALMRLAPALFPSELLGPVTPDRVEQRHLGAHWLVEDSRRLAFEQLQAAADGSAEDDADGSFLYALSAEPEGARWLLQVARVIEARELGPQQFNDDNYDDLIRGLRSFSRLEALAAEDDPGEVVAQLRNFRPDTLWLLLMFSGAAQPLLLRALGAESLLPLQQWTERMRRRVYNSENSGSGRVDLAEVEAALAGVDDRLLQRYLQAVLASRVDHDEHDKVFTLLEAVRGRNRAKLEKALARHGQIAAKAYGLLPLAGADDARQRYLTLKRVWKEASRYGAERQANTRAAVSVGLANLAQRAGYRDEARMEWAMEAAIGGEAAARLQPQQIDAWQVSVQMEGGKPVLRIDKDGKTLKSVPAGLRKQPAFVALREAIDELKQQATRFRRTLEQLMCDGEALPRADVERLAQIPAVAFLLSTLVGIDGMGAVGLIDPAHLQLRDGDKATPIRDSLRIAHGLDLLGAGTLAHWQRQIVQARLVQPFKQVFRELYVPTPAELETHSWSNRFAGHVVNGATAYRLLQSRGWSSSEGTAWRRFPEAGCQVEWQFPDVHHYLAEDEAVTADRLSFHRGNDTLALAEVPPLAFSEAMRDADLVVSVAAVSDDGAYWSAEASQHRRELVQELAGLLGLKGLRFEDNFVYLQGRLAAYRIHLGSGVIHIMPGSYLCIVPAPEGKAAASYYLPFADSDRKSSEIISKLLLLANDHKIRDESILAQIRREA